MELSSVSSTPDADSTVSAVSGMEVGSAVFAGSGEAVVVAAGSVGIKVLVGEGGSDVAVSLAGAAVAPATTTVASAVGV